jgi:threonine synthase
MGSIFCVKCHFPYPDDSNPYRCPKCGGIFDFEPFPKFDAEKIEPAAIGMWRYRNMFDLPSGNPEVTLGEGNTPLLWLKTEGEAVGVKCEHLNPTGSYKDRGSAVLASHLAGRGINLAVEDSSGNAGASFAAYAARAGIQARIFVPEAASGPKRKQIEQYGAELVRVPGPRSEAAKAVREQADACIPYASHAYLPFGLAGIATIAYEIWEQMGRTAPGSIIAPVGHGGLLLGLVRGFGALKAAGLIRQQPYFVGVQAAACAPVALAFDAGKAEPELVAEQATLAEGVRVQTPIRGAALLKEISREYGTFVSIAEAEILPAYEELGKCGIYVEPTSALAWCAWKLLNGKIPAPVVLVLTGTGLKYDG